MKAHRIVLSITGIILIIEIIVYLILFKTGVLSNYYKMFSLILGMLWFFFYPIALYTCYYHIGKGDKKGTFLEKMLSGFAADNVFALLVIPLLIAPFFTYDYILLFKDDYRKHKWNKEMNNSIDS